MPTIFERFYQPSSSHVTSVTRDNSTTDPVDSHNVDTVKRENADHTNCRQSAESTSTSSPSKTTQSTPQSVTNVETSAECDHQPSALDRRYARTFELIRTFANNNNHNNNNNSNNNTTRDLLTNLIRQCAHEERDDVIDGNDDVIGGNHDEQIVDDDEQIEDGGGNEMIEADNLENKTLKLEANTCVEKSEKLDELQLKLDADNADSKLSSETEIVLPKSDVPEVSVKVDPEQAELKSDLGTVRRKSTRMSRSVCEPMEKMSANIKLAVEEKVVGHSARERHISPNSETGL